MYSTLWFPIWKTSFHQGRNVFHIPTSSFHLQTVKKHKIWIYWNHSACLHKVFNYMQYEEKSSECCTMYIGRFLDFKLTRESCLWCTKIWVSKSIMFMMCKNYEFHSANVKTTELRTTYIQVIWVILSVRGPFFCEIWNEETISVSHSKHTCKGVIETYI